MNHPLDEHEEPVQNDVHPLDREDDALDSPKDTSRKKSKRPKKQDDSEGAYRPLLIPAIYALVAFFVIAFLAGVSAANSAPNSVGETVGSIINRVAVFGMLFAFFVLLIAYRIPHLRRLFNADYTNIPRKFSSLFILCMLNLAGLVVAWICLYLASELMGRFLYPIISVLFVFSAGLLATMAIWHQGIVRAYAVGCLSAILCLAGSGLMSTWAFSPMFGGGRSVLFWPMGLALTLIAFTGMLSAAYVWVLMLFREKEATTDKIVDPPQI